MLIEMDFSPMMSFKESSRSKESISLRLKVTTSSKCSTRQVLNS